MHRLPGSGSRVVPLRIQYFWIQIQCYSIQILITESRLLVHRASVSTSRLVVNRVQCSSSQSHETGSRLLVHRIFRFGSRVVVHRVSDPDPMLQYTESRSRIQTSSTQSLQIRIQGNTTKRFWSGAKLELHTFESRNSYIGLCNNIFYYLLYYVYLDLRPKKRLLRWATDWVSEWMTHRIKILLSGLWTLLVL